MPQRRLPKQARSRELVDRVLTAAGQLFTELGYAATTTNLVADRAGVSIGSVYQFFADKQEMLAALQETWTARLGVALDAHLAVTAEFDPADLVDRALEVHASLNQDPPGLLGFLLSTPVVTRSPGVSEAIHERIVELLRRSAPALSEDRRTVAAGMIMHITNGLYALGRPAGATDPAIRAEVRHALLSYLTTLV